MTTTMVKAIITCEIQRVWEMVSKFECYSEWRSDVIKTEMIGEKQFMEYAKEDYSTSVTVTAAEQNRRLELDRENSHVKGHWTLLFTPKEDETEIVFTSEVIAKQLSTRPIGKGIFEKEYAKKEQEQFINDLKKCVEKTDQ